MAVRQAACEAAEKSVATSSLSKDGMVSILDNGIGGISLLTSGGEWSQPLETMQPQTGWEVSRIELSRSLNAEWQRG